MSKFSSYGQKTIVEAKKNGTLVNFARNMPTPKEHKKLLAENVKAKNSDIWARYVFREAFGIEGKDLGPEWAVFSSQLQNSYSSRDSTQQIKRYKELLASHLLDDKKIKKASLALL